MPNKWKKRKRLKGKGVIVKFPLHKYLYDEFWNQTQHGRLVKHMYQLGRSMARRQEREFFVALLKGVAKGELE